MKKTITYFSLLIIATIQVAYGAYTENYINTIAFEDRYQFDSDLNDLVIRTEFWISGATAMGPSGTINEITIAISPMTLGAKDNIELGINIPHSNYDYVIHEDYNNSSSSGNADTWIWPYAGLKLFTNCSKSYLINTSDESKCSGYPIAMTIYFNTPFSYTSRDDIFSWFYLKNNSDPYNCGALSQSECNSNNLCEYINSTCEMVIGDSANLENVFSKAILPADTTIPEEGADFISQLMPATENSTRTSNEFGAKTLSECTKYNWDSTCSAVFSNYISSGNFSPGGAKNFTLTEGTDSAFATTRIKSNQNSGSSFTDTVNDPDANVNALDNHFYESNHRTTNDSRKRCHIFGIGCACTPTQVANSNFSKTASLTGYAGDTKTVTCKSGYTGGGTWTCQSSGTFTGDNCTLNVDFDSPYLASSNPANNSTNISVSANIVLTFDENVFAGSGKIKIIKTSDSSIFEEISITDSRITISGTTVTINPSSDLSNNTQYHVTIDSGAISDSSGNAFPAITDSSAISFTTEGGAEGCVIAGITNAASPHNSEFNVASGASSSTISCSTGSLKGSSNVSCEDGVSSTPPFCDINYPAQGISSNYEVYGHYNNTFILDKNANNLVYWGRGITGGTSTNKYFLQTHIDSGWNFTNSTGTKSDVGIYTNSGGAMEEACYVEASTQDVVCPKYNFYRWLNSRTAASNFGITESNNVTITTFSSRAVAAGASGSACLTTSAGKLYCWGVNLGFFIDPNQDATATISTPVELNINEFIHEAVVLGNKGACIIYGNQRKVRCWGENKSGGFGHGTDTTYVWKTSLADSIYCYENCSTPGSEVSTISLQDAPDVIDYSDSTVTNAYKLTTDYNGNNICVATYNANTSSYGMKCWGINQSNSLGDTNTNYRTSYCTGKSQSVCNNDLDCYYNGGTNSCMGRYLRLKAVSHTFNDPVYDFAMGSFYSCFLIGSKVSCVGSNNYGQLGRNSTTLSFMDMYESGTPIYVNYIDDDPDTADIDESSLTMSNVVNISAGYDHTCAIDNTNRIFCWGHNNYYAVGNPTVVGTYGNGDKRTYPFKIIDLP